MLAKKNNTDTHRRENYMESVKNRLHSILSWDLDYYHQFFFTMKWKTITDIGLIFVMYWKNCGPHKQFKPFWKWHFNRIQSLRNIDLKRALCVIDIYIVWTKPCISITKFNKINNYFFQPFTLISFWCKMIE